MGKAQGGHIRLKVFIRPSVGQAKCLIARTRSVCLGAAPSPPGLIRESVSACVRIFQTVRTFQRLELDPCRKSSIDAFLFGLLSSERP